MISLIGVPFDFMGLSYYQTNKDVALGDLVVCETPHGTYIGEITKIREASEEETKKENFSELFPPIIRIATFQDKNFYRNAVAREAQISKTTQEEANALKLNMKVLQSHMDVEDDKVLITFTADQRVDFRELVRILNGTFHLRIELRQIGPRDQAKVVGGIGPCGLPICCSTFLKTFDGISIAMAKNQLLAINIPKLSGQCGKLMCCLKFEDKAYSEIRPLYPKIGEKFLYHNSNYEVTGLNLLNDTITAYNGESYETFTKQEFERVKLGLEKSEQKILKGDINAGIDLSGHGVKDTNNRIAQIKRSEERHQENLRNAAQQQQQSNKNNQNNKNNNRNNNQKQANNQNNIRNRNQNQNQNNNRNNSQQNNNRNNQNNNRNQNRNNQNFNNRNRNNNFQRPSKPVVKKDSGFIPVSQIADKSVLEFTPVRNKDQDDDKE